MAVFEVFGGPITHRYLMKRSREELCRRYAEVTGSPATSEFKSLLKAAMASRLLTLYRELPND